MRHSYCLAVYSKGRVSPAFLFPHRLTFTPHSIIPAALVTATIPPAAHDGDLFGGLLRHLGAA